MKYRYELYRILATAQLEMHTRYFFIMYLNCSEDIPHDCFMDFSLRIVGITADALAIAIRRITKYGGFAKISIGLCTFFPSDPSGSILKPIPVYGQSRNSGLIEFFKQCFMGTIGEMANGRDRCVVF